MRAWGAAATPHDAIHVLASCAPYDPEARVACPPGEGGGRGGGSSCDGSARTRLGRALRTACRVVHHRSTPTPTPTPPLPLPRPLSTGLAWPSGRGLVSGGSSVGPSAGQGGLPGESLRRHGRDVQVTRNPTLTMTLAPTLAPTPAPTPAPTLALSLALVLSLTPASMTGRAARAAGISTEKDEIRASLAGKRGTVLEADDGDQTAKVRVTVQPAVGDKSSEVSLCWFPIAALEPA